MRNIVKRTAAGAVLGGSLLFTVGLGIASAVPATDVSDQLVDLQIGNGTPLHGVNVDVASQIAGLLCGTGANVSGTAESGVNANGTPATGMSANTANPNGTNVSSSEITAQARQVDAGQIPTTTCDSNQGVVTISQNVTANAPNTAPNSVNTPGAQNGNSTPPTAPTPAQPGPLGPAPTS